MWYGKRYSWHGPTFKASRAASSSACFSTKSASLASNLPRAAPGHLKPQESLYACLVHVLSGLGNREGRIGKRTARAALTATSTSFPEPMGTVVISFFDACDDVGVRNWVKKMEKRHTRIDNAVDGKGTCEWEKTSHWTYSIVAGSMGSTHLPLMNNLESQRLQNGREY